VNDRGSVIRVRLDPAQGSEQAGTRPAVVISPELLNRNSSVLLVAPVTSKKTDRVFPFEALLDQSSCGLNTPSKAMLNQLRTIDKSRVTGTYGYVDREGMNEIDRALSIAVGLNAL
jgi:mRNA interferase MazF